MSFGRDATGFMGADPLAKRRKRKKPAPAKKGDNGFPAVLANGDDERGREKRPMNRNAMQGWIPNRDKHLHNAESLFGGLLSDSEFVLVDPEQIELCAQIYDSDSLIKVVTSVMLNSILGGGLDLVRPGFTLRSTAKAFYSRTWIRFVQDLMRSLWAFGFAIVATEPHPVYKAIPHVMRIELLQVAVCARASEHSCVRVCQVRMVCDIWNVRHYTVHTRAQGGGFQFLGRTSGRQLGMRASHQGAGQGTETPVPDLMVFELDPPSPTGQLQSRVHSLMADIMYYRYMLQVDWHALHRRAEPVVVTTKEYKPYDRDGEPTIMAQYAQAGVAASHASMVEPLSIKQQEQRDAVRAQLDAIRMARRLPPGANALPVGGHMPRAAANDVVGPASGPWEGMLRRFDVEPGRDVHDPPKAEEPTYLMEMRICMEERVGSLFGVPRSMFSRYSGQDPRGEQSGRFLFTEASLSWKNNIIPILTTVFAKIYASEFLDDAAQIALSDNIDLGDAMAVCNVAWQLPGVPPPSVITELWREGSLKREAYLNFVSHLYGLPMSAFNPTPEIQVRELAGIVDAPQGGEGDTGPKLSGKPPGPQVVRPPKVSVDEAAVGRIAQQMDNNPLGDQ